MSHKYTQLDAHIQTLKKHGQNPEEIPIRINMHIKTRPNKIILDKILDPIEKAQTLAEFHEGFIQSTEELMDTGIYSSITPEFNFYRTPTTLENGQKVNLLHVDLDFGVKEKSLIRGVELSMVETPFLYDWPTFNKQQEQHQEQATTNFQKMRQAVELKQGFGGSSVGWAPSIKFVNIFTFLETFQVGGFVHNIGSPYEGNRVSPFVKFDLPIIKGDMVKHLSASYFPIANQGWQHFFNVKCTMPDNHQLGYATGEYPEGTYHQASYQYAVNNIKRHEVSRVPNGGNLFKFIGRMHWLGRCASAIEGKVNASLYTKLTSLGTVSFHTGARAIQPVAASISNLPSRLSVSGHDHSNLFAPSSSSNNHFAYVGAQWTIPLARPLGFLYELTFLQACFFASLGMQSSFDFEQGDLATHVRTFRQWMYGAVGMGVVYQVNDATQMTWQLVNRMHGDTAFAPAFEWRLQTEMF